MERKRYRKLRKEFLLLIGAAVLALALLVWLVVGIVTALCAPSPAESTQPPPPPALLPNPYGPADFGEVNGYLTCLTGESVLGIDVSQHQRDIDWPAVRAAGVEFVMIRVGFRGYKTGRLDIDDYAQINYEGAKAAGLQVGAYFYSQALTPEEAREEAEFALAAMKGWELDLPMVFDWEYVSSEARTGDVSAIDLTACTRAFCETVEKAGYDAMLYFNQSQGRDLLKLPELTEYGFWLAMYKEEMTYPHRVDMWQYTCEGSVPGIRGHVDINLYFPEK